MQDDIMKILFIDDEEGLLDEAKRHLENDLRSQGIEAQIIPVNTVDDGLSKLKNQFFHLVIVDLKFDGDSRGGNDIITQILDQKILPIIVYSGFISDLDSKFLEHNLI